MVRVSPLVRTNSKVFKPHLQVLNVEGGLSWIAQSVELSFFGFLLSEIKKVTHLSNIPPSPPTYKFALQYLLEPPPSPNRGLKENMALGSVGIL